MARTALSDYFQVFPFWLMDIAPIEPLALPIFSPLMGFSQITAPEMSMDIREFTEANWLFSRKTINRASASNITLSRAAKWYDSDFYRWALCALSGDTGGRGSRGVLGIGGATPRRDLLLIQFLSRTPVPSPYAEAAAASGILSIQGAATTRSAAMSGASSAGVYGLSAAGIGGAAAIAGAVGAPLGPVEFAPRVPGKAWILYGCLPARFKPISDFDAMGGAISIAEIEVVVEHWDEISLGSEMGSVIMGASEAAR